MDEVLHSKCDNKVKSETSDVIDVEKDGTDDQEVTIVKDFSPSVSLRLKRRRQPDMQVNNHPSSKSELRKARPATSNKRNAIILKDKGDTKITEDDCSLKTISKAKRSSKSKGFECVICGRIATSSQRLKEHMSCHNGLKHLQCEICGKQFAWRYSFRSHMVCHSKDNPNKCYICDKKYCNKSALKNHIIRIHGNPNKDFKCKECGKCFITNAELERHSFNHSKEKPYVCEYCGKTYRFKAALVVHYRVHSCERPYKCGFCDETFIHMSALIGHRRRHTGEKPFKCKICEKLFRVKRSMISHMSVHTENRPFKCEKCGKTFRSRSGFRVHLDFHLGVKRYICKYCGRAFRAWCNMHKHMRRHTGERPHVCETCGKTFIEKQELRNHTKSHNKDNEKLLVKMNDVSCSVISDIDPDDPAPAIEATVLLNSCSSSDFSYVQHPNIANISTHPEIIENDQHMFYNTLSHDKNRHEKCCILSESYEMPFFNMHCSLPQYVTQNPSFPNMHTGNQPCHLMTNRSVCMSTVNSENFSCSNLNNPHYDNFNFNVEPNTEQLVKCKLCRSLFQSLLFLKRHLLEYHRIDEENVQEVIA